MSEHKIPIPSMIYNAAVGGHVTSSQQIIDEILNKEQSVLNVEQQELNKGILEEKEYISSSNNGMGRIVLRKNIVEGVNTLTQSMINKSNTIYVIQYDFTLIEDITIPENCVLKFDGGSLNGNNSILTYNKTTIEDFTKGCLLNIVVNGSVANKISHSYWFCPYCDGIHDDSVALQNFINGGGSEKIVDRDNYYVSNTVQIYSYQIIDFSMSTIHTLTDNITMFQIKTINNQYANTDNVIKNFYINSSHNGTVALEVGPDAYFNYVYNFNIILTGNNCIGIKENSNFNTIVRDGRIIGSSSSIGCVGIKLITGEGHDNQVTNLLIDSVLIQRLEIGVKFDYGTTANDSIKLTNLGFSSCNYAIYSDGYTNAEISCTRAENTNKFIYCNYCRGITITNLYLVNSGFAEIVDGYIIVTGYLFAVTTQENVTTKQFLKMTGGSIIVTPIIFNNLGYGIDDFISENAKIYDSNRNRHSSFAKAINCYGSTIIENNQVYSKNINNTKIKLCLSKGFFNKTDVPSSNTNIDLYASSKCFGISSDVWTIKRGTSINGQQIRFVSTDGNPHLLSIPNVGIFQLSKWGSLTAEVIIDKDDKFSMAVLDGAELKVVSTISSDRPSLAATQIGFFCFDKTLNKPIWWNGTNWVDATGTTV